MEDLERLFDSCDTAYVGRVPVSKLILSVTKEVSTFNNNDHQQDEKEEILMTVRYLLDPSDEDNLVDKATWMAAWRKQAETPSPKKSALYTISDLSGGDGDASGDCPGLLDVSKHSYCFSPGSRSSSLEESEELTQLREENEQLQSSLKIVKQQLQTLDEALLQEQIEKQELEKSKDLELNKLAKQIKSLIDGKQELKCSLEVCEREKLDLCKSYDSLHVTDRQLKFQLAEQKRVVAALSLEIEDFNQEKDNLQQHIVELETKLQHQSNVHQEQVREYKEKIQNYQEEKEELNSQIASTMLDKSKSSACWDEMDCGTISNNLQAELHSFNFESPRFLPDSPPTLEKSLLVEMQAVRMHAETQTQSIFQTPPKKIDRYSQMTPVKTVTPVARHDAETQMDLSITLLRGVDKCNQVEVEMSPVETQTTPDINVKPTGVEKCIQVELTMHPVETQTSPQTFWSNEIPSFSSAKLQQSFRKPPLKGAILKKPSDLRYSQILSEESNHKQVLSPTPMTYHADTQTELNHNIIVPVGVDKLSSKSEFKCLWVASTFIIFLILLIISTIFCTGAVLQIASDSGVLAFPYLGQTPEIVKTITSPFVKVNVRPMGINVPV